MPFTKTGPNAYKSPSWRTFDKAQVALFYANGGKFPGQDADKATEPKADADEKTKKMHRAMHDKMYGQ